MLIFGNLTHFNEMLEAEAESVDEKWSYTWNLFEFKHSSSVVEQLDAFAV